MKSKQVAYGNLLGIMRCMALVFVSVLLSVYVSPAQERTVGKLDMDEISRLVGDSSSASYYPKLLERYNAFDPTLTREEYSLLYYGFAFQPDYIKAEFAEMGSYLKSMIAGGGLLDALAECDRLLGLSPVSMELNRIRSYLGFKLRRPAVEVQNYMSRFVALLDVVSNSGDGRSDSTAYHVIFIADEALFMDYSLGSPQVVSHSATNARCDIINVEPSELYPDSVIYFNVEKHRVELVKFINSEERGVSDFYSPAMQKKKEDLTRQEKKKRQKQQQEQEEWDILMPY